MADYNISDKLGLKEYNEQIKLAVSSTADFIAGEQKALTDAIAAGVKVKETSVTATNAEKKAKTELQKISEQQISVIKKIKVAETGQNKVLLTSKIRLQQKTAEQKKNIKAYLEAKTAITNAELALKKEIKTIRDAEAANAKLRLGVKNLDATTDKGRAAILLYNSAINSNTKFIQKNSDTMLKGKQQVGLYKDNIIAAGKQMIGFTGFAGAATLAIRKVGDALADARADVILFEKEFANVLTLLDEAQKLEFKDQLEEGAITTMAKYGLTIEDTTKSLFDAISAGVGAGDAIQFLDDASRVATAGNASLSSVVDGATTVLNAYGSKAGSTTDILNSFFAAQVKGKTTVGLLASNIGKVASQAASADIPITELMSTAAGLTKFIGGTEESMTALSGVMNAIIKPSNEAKAVFDSVKLSTGKVGIETGITAIKQNGLLETILKVADAYEQDNDVLAELIPNVRAFKGLAGLTSEAVAELKQNTLDLNDSEAASLAVQQALNEQMSTRQKQSERLEAASAALNLERDKNLVGLRKLASGWRELRIAKKLENAETLRNLISGKELKAQVFEEIENVKELTGETLTYGEALERVNKAKAEQVANEPLDLGDDLEAPEAFNIDFDLLKEQQKKQKEVTDEYLKDNKELEEQKREEHEKTVKAFDDLMKEQEADELRGFALSIENEQKLTDYKINLTEEELEAAQDQADKLLAIELKRIDDEKAANEELKQQKIAIANQLFSFGQALGDRRIANLEQQTDAEGNITEEAAAKIAKIEKRQAIADKAQALFNIYISTAEAAAKVSAQTGIGALIAAPAITAFGLLQAATVIATPIPEFKDGVMNFGGGMAIVGDGGESELVRNPDGSMWVTPDVPTATYLQKGSDVLNKKQIQNEYGMDVSELSKKLDKTNDLLRGQLMKKGPNPMTAKQYDSANRKQAFRDKVALKSKGKQ